MVNVLMAVAGFGQVPQPAPAKPVARRPPAYPDRLPGDPAMVLRGKALYGLQCTFCHGAAARGGSAGPNLLRAELVLNDKDGELIGHFENDAVDDCGGRREGRRAGILALAVADV